MKQLLLLLWISVFSINSFYAQNIDYQILKNLNKYQSPADTRFNKFVSDATAPLSIGTPLMILGVGLIENNDVLKQKGLQTGVAFAMTVGEAYVLKRIFNRPRPYVTYPDLKNLGTEKSLSFPSGHTSAAFSVATSLSLNFPKWYIIAPVYGWAAMTGYSRMYLNVHYPSDVLAGAVLGSGTAWLTWHLNKKWLQKRKKNKVG